MIGNSGVRKYIREFWYVVRGIAVHFQILQEMSSEVISWKLLPDNPKDLQFKYSIGISVFATPQGVEVDACTAFARAVSVCVEWSNNIIAYFKFLYQLLRFFQKKFRVRNDLQIADKTCIPMCISEKKKSRYYITLRRSGVWPLP